MDKALLGTLAERYGTPLYVFDEDALAARMHACREIVGSKIALTYSIKANPFFIPAMQQLVGTLEVCSPGELELCHALNVPPEDILLSGVQKSMQDIERALDLGVRRMTCESLLHVERIDQAARARGIRVPVLLRLTAGSQFGMDESDLLSVLRKRNALTGLDIVGLHYFSGTQQKRLKGQRKELEMLSAFIDRLDAEEGFLTQEVEYGAGLYFPYFVGEDAEDTLSPLRELAPDLQNLANQCHLTVEMGRFFTAPCGAYLSSVADVKVNRGASIAILDGGMHHVNYYGGSMGMRLPHITLLNDESCPDETRDWMLCGSLCTTADVLVRSAPLPSLAVGDVLAFHHTGAYSVTEAPALFLSRDLPRVVLLREHKPHLVRDTLHSWAINLPHFT